MKRWIASIAILATLLGVAVGFGIKLNRDNAILQLRTAIREQQLKVSERELERCTKEVSQLTDEDVQNVNIVSGLQEKNNKLGIQVTDLENDIAYWENQVNRWQVLYAELETVRGIRHFASQDELQQWLWDDPTSDNDYSYRYDCDDFAMDLIRAAEKDGYLIGMYSEEDHVTNFANIGNTVYIIEPQTDEVWLWGYVD